MQNDIFLRKIIKEDLDAYFKWINDKTLVEFNSKFTPVTKNSHLEWYENISSMMDIKTFSIIKKTEDKLIGSCSLRNIDFIKHVAELQIRIGEKGFYNKGYGSQAIELLIQYGFLELNLKKIYLHVFDDNIRAIKAYENCNFTKEKLIKNFSIIDGNKKHAYLMSIIKNKYLEISKYE